MNWPALTREIQKNFFRDGVYTHLEIVEIMEDSMISWIFSFMDFGMYHEITGSSQVIDLGSGRYWINNRLVASDKDALQQVFGGHFDAFMEELYTDLNFAPCQESCHFQVG